MTISLVVLLTLFLTISENVGAVEDVNCTDLRNTFANASAQFTLCSIDNSRPIKLCENCVNAYIYLLDSYKTMSEVHINGTKCIDHFINLDRLQILETIYTNSIDLWNRAKCYQCFIIQNGTKQSPKRTKITEQFLTYYNTFNSCINQTQDKQQLCSNCMDNYLLLDNYYREVSNVNERIGICMDIVDLMNNTWTYWSINCCKFRRHNEYIFISSSIGILLITVFFYLTTQFYKEKKAPTILQQSRFAESFNIQ